MNPDTTSPISPRPSAPAVVITGTGMVTSLGDHPAAVWERVAACECGLGPMSALEQALPEGHSGAQAVDLPDDFAPDLPREARYLRWTMLQALREARVDPLRMPYAPERCGIVLGTTLHGMRAGGQFLRTNDFGLLKDFLAGSTLARAAEGLPFAGDAATTCSACSSSLGSVALAITLLEGGQLDLVIAGGYDATSEYAYAGFNSLRLVAPGALRPFSKERLGMKLGEGYGVVVLEREADARRRDATPIVRVLGWGESADAHHLTQPHPEGAGAAAAIGAALNRAGLTTTDVVDLVAAHATGTPDNDKGEAAALAAVFGDEPRRVPVVAFKSHLGHTLGGAGAVELILSATALRRQQIPGCTSIAADEVEYDHLNLSIGRARPATIRATLNASLGFGGANTCVVLGPADDAVEAPAVIITERERVAPREVLITGVGVVLPGAIGNEAFVRKLAEPKPTAPPTDSGPIPEEQFLHLLNARRVRRMSDYVKLTLAATSLACADAGVTLPGDGNEGATWSAILGSAHGSAQYCHTYYRQVVDEGLAAANPMLFAEGVPNAAAAHLSLMLGLKGACQTIIGSRTAGLDALRLASLRIATGQWERAIVSAAEEFFPLINQGYAHCGLYAGDSSGSAFEGDRGFAVGCGAVTLVLESAESAHTRGVRVRGAIEATSSARLTKGGGPDGVSRLVNELGDVRTLYSSANATWVDRLESTAARRLNPSASLTTLYGRWPELFSVGPLAAVAAGLLAGDSPGGAFGVLCTGYTGTATAARVRRVGR